MHSAWLRLHTCVGAGRHPEALPGPVGIGLGGGCPSSSCRCGHHRMSVGALEGKRADANDSCIGGRWGGYKAAGLASHGPAALLARHLHSPCR